MRYWDASALVPLVVAEEASARALGWIEEDPLVVTWIWTRVELTGAVERWARQGEISVGERRTLLDRVGDLASQWDEVVDVVAVRLRALALLARHDLRAADAAQLGAAMLAAQDDPSGLVFVCLDERLAAAADREGLRVLSVGP